MKQTIFKNGLLAGVVTMAFLSAVYAIDKTWLFSMTVISATLVLYMLPMYRAANDVKMLEFKAVLRTAFVVFLIANAIYYVFDWVLFNIVDKSLANVQAELAIEYYRPSTPIDKQSELADGIRAANIHDVKSLIYRFVRGAIGGFGMAVLAAFLVKRQQA